MRILVLTAVAAAALVTAASAAAHVTVHPNRLPAGTFTTFVVRVPNERPNAATTKVDVQLPPGFFFVSTAPVPGWTAKLVQRKLATPVKLGDDTADTEVGQVIWSGGRIEPGQFLELPLSVAVPDQAGATLTFKAVQTYSNGEVVRWIGEPGSDVPAPQVVLTAKTSPVVDVPAGAATDPGGSGGGGHTTLALVLGIAGLAAGLLALAVSLLRRRA